MTRGPEEAQAIASLITDAFCECQSSVQADVGRLSGEIYRRVDIEGRSLEAAAAAAGLSMRDARTVLFLFRRQMAGALAGSILASRLPDTD